ncbi:MAG: hypothetical protein ABIJ03_01570 [Patescibacteria group bacterium]
MMSDYPSISAFPENLILLTASQHLTHAHSGNNTKNINREYQLICLISKSETIEKSLQEGKFYYTKKDFLYVIKIGLEKKIGERENFDQIRNKLVAIYQESSC